MLARHHQGTQKIVISDNIFVTEKKKKNGSNEKRVAMGEFCIENTLMLVRFVSSVAPAFPS